MCFSKKDVILHDINRKSLDDIGLDENKDNCDYVNLDDTATLICNKKDLVVVQLNVRGLLSKQKELLNLVNNCTKNKKVDVIILCETWATKETKPLIDVPGYEFVGIERNQKKGGGVGFLIAKELQYKIRNQYNKMLTHMECFYIENSH